MRPTRAKTVEEFARRVLPGQFQGPARAAGGPS